MFYGEKKKLSDYGPHQYADHDGTSDCKFGCGCWMGPSRSGGPAGIYPGGHCPNNPLDGVRQEGKGDYHDCVNGLINKLASEKRKAESELLIAQKADKSNKTDLLNELEGLKLKYKQLRSEVQKKAAEIMGLL